MKTVRVYAHHGPIPPEFLGTLTPAQLPAPPGPPPIGEFWCELADQSTVDSVGYGPDGAVTPDQWRWDLGFATDATDFTVTDLGVLLVGGTLSDYQFVVVAPSGLPVPQPAGVATEPMAPMPEWGDPSAPYGGLQQSWMPPQPLVAAKGVWRIQVFPSEGSPAAPVPSSWAGGVTCVQLAEAADGGFLAIEFTGIELLPTTTPPPTTTTTTTTPPPTTTTTTTTTPPPTTTTTTPPPTTTTTTTTTTTPPPTTTTTPVPATTTTTTPAPTTTTTPAPTTTTTTPVPPTTTTTTPAPPTTTTTTTTTPAPLRDRLGWFGTVVLLVALALTTAAAVSFFVWACEGYIGVGLFATAVSLTAAAMFLLPAWTLLFRTGAVFDQLSLWFARLSAGMPLLASVLAIIGELNCAGGALIASGLFGTILSVLTLSRRIALRRRW